jgi:V/A-type H+/Na+-transporting ATPase subunit I
MPKKELNKANFLIYEDHKEEFLRDLQEKGIFHITNSRISTLAEENPDLIPEEKFTDGEAEEIFKKLQDIVELLKDHAEGKGVLGQFIDLKTGIPPEEYREIVENFDADEINQISDWESELYHLKNKVAELSDKREFYEEWVDLKAAIAEFDEIKNVAIKVYKLSADKEELEQKLNSIPVDFHIIFESQKKLGVIFFIYKGFEEDFKKAIADYEAEIVDFKDEEKEPAQIVTECKKEINELNKKISIISEKISQKGSDYQKYIVLYDYFLSRIDRAEVMNKGLSTRKVFFLEGWVDKDNRAILQNIADEYEGVELNWVKPTEGEKIPVKLKNNALSNPYEAITGLYALPKSGEVDPTPYIAMFFAVFFGFCMTDAAYGIVLVAVSLYLMPKLPEGRKYLWIFVGGGVLTIFAGAITGSWFGNNIEMAFPELAAISVFREKLTLFDPFENPLNFLKLSMVFGAVQIFTGLIVSIKEKIKNEKYFNAFANEISWILFFIFLGSFAVSGNNICKYLMLVPLVIIFLFSSRSKSVVMRLAKGGFTVFNELISFLGNILSYSRIMALGLVTAGLAMSVNILAKIVRELVPGFGIVLAILIFIGGHLFSIAINTLSSFVHTMRLQFAEFFPYFYEGGGERFEPFSLVGKYTRIEKKEVLSD